MIYFAKWKIVLVVLICALGVIYAAPNLFGRQAATVTAQSEVTGTYGSFSIQSNGRWTYVLDTEGAAYRSLASNESRTETFTVTVTGASQEGATRDVTVTVRGGGESTRQTGALDIRTEQWSDDLPAWLPVKRVNLGLDLQGGTHLLARVEYQEIVTRQAEALEGNIRRAMRDADIGRQGGIELRGDSVFLTLRNPADSDRLQDARNGAR